MRSKLSMLYNQLRIPFKYYTRNLLRFIRKRDEDDHNFNNPFVIY